MASTYKTIAEALAAGLHELTEREIIALPESIRKPVHYIVSPCTIGTGGNYCGETPCVGGKRYLIYCNTVGSCTRYVAQDC